MNALPIALTIAVAAGVEAIEATTVVFAVGMTRSWKPALLGSFWAVVALVLLVTIFGEAFVRVVPVRVFEIVVGTAVLLFGLKWLRKAVQRWAGLRARADQAKSFDRAAAHVRGDAGDSVAFASAFGAVLLEGVEVAIVVVTFGVSGIGVPLAVLSALAGILTVTICAIVLRGPLTRVPENTLKFVVGVMLSTFGTYWVVEGLGIGWPAEEFAMPSIALWYLVLSFGCVVALRRRLRTAKS